MEFPMLHGCNVSDFHTGLAYAMATYFDANGWYVKTYNFNMFLVRWDGSKVQSPLLRDKGMNLNKKDRHKPYRYLKPLANIPKDCN